MAIISILLLTILKHSNEISAQQEQHSNSSSANYGPTAPIAMRNSATESQLIPVGPIVVSLIVSVVVGMQMLEFFSINLSRKHAQEASRYGEIRLFGSLGCLTSSLAMTLFTKPTLEQIADLGLSFELLTLVVAVFVGAPGLILSCLWPDEQPFDTNICTADARDQGTKFDFTQNVWACKSIENESRLESDLALDANKSIEMTRADISYQFDTRQEDAFRNIRRCSLAPLGDSFFVKQFELDHKNVRHFNFVTNVQPLASKSTGDKFFIPQMSDSLNTDLDDDDDDKGVHTKGPNDETTERGHSDPARFSPATGAATTHLPVDIQLRLLKDLATRNGSFIRVLCSLIFIGIIRALSASCPEHSNGQAMNAAPLGYLCEIVFYYKANYLVKLFSFQSSLVFIMLILASTLGLQMTCTHLIDIQTVGLLVTTISGAVCSAWLSCVLAELAIEFAAESRFCLVELIRTKQISCDEECKNGVRNGLKATVVCLLFSSVNEMGTTLGSSLGLNLFTNYGCSTVCLLTIGLALTFVLINLIVHQSRY